MFVLIFTYMLLGEGKVNYRDLQLNLFGTAAILQAAIGYMSLTL